MENTTAMESPLDVLSRAATMLQQCADRKPRDNVGKEVSASARWRRERRPCPLMSRPRTEPKTLAQDNSNEMAPLDMSTRRKPSNDIQISKISPGRTLTNLRSGFKNSSNDKPAQRVSVITCAAPTSQSSGSSAEEEEDTHEAESDTVIDEHFRRSLGQDYLALFPAPAQTTSDNKKSPTLPTKAVAPNNVTLTGLSVDDHFAKALGETWLRLQANEKTTETSEKPKVTSSSEVNPESTNRKSTSTVLHAALKVST